MDILNSDGLSYLYGKIKDTFQQSEPGKGLSANDFTDELKHKVETSKSSLMEATDDDLVDFFQRAAALGLISVADPVLGNKYADWSTNWYFSKDGQTYQLVTLPHTCNTEDGLSDSYFRGIGYYRKTISIIDATADHYIDFHAVGQECKVYVDDTLIYSYSGGYTPFVVKLPELAEGEHLLHVVCDNSVNNDRIPLSADFNFNNGLHEKVFYYTQYKIGFDPTAFGYDRMHITQETITDTSAYFRVESKVISKYNVNKTVTLKFTLLDGETAVLEDTIDVAIDANGTYSYNKDFTLELPHLWNGVKDPFLYTAKLQLMERSIQAESISAQVGFRFFSMDPENGFMLNGVSYPLRGVALHQDFPEKMSAMSEADFDSDYYFVRDIGANMVRLAHYPHYEYAYRLCDQMGLVVQTEIPWVNHVGVNATAAYYNCIQDNFTSMVKNYYNHCSIIFWGMSNELNGSHFTGNTDPQGGYDEEKAKEWNNTLYAYAKTLDTHRYIGLSTHSSTFIKTSPYEWNADWIGSNQYAGWYYNANNMNAFGTNMDNYRAKTSYWAVTEYGCGMNPATHSSNPLVTTDIGSGGSRHDEEYGCLFHESYLAQIQARPWLIFTTAWILFDFAVAGRNEGGTPYTNDKGLVTRDRGIKKDPFFLYKAAWSSENVLRIVSKRYTTRDTDSISLKVYSNADSLDLYVYPDQTTPVQTLNAPTRCGCIWDFGEVPFTTSILSIGVVGKFGDERVVDTAEFATTAELAGDAPTYYVDIDFSTGTNASLTAIDKMGRATVNLSGFTGTTTSGYNGVGLCNADGAGIVTLTNLNLHQITTPIEIGIETTGIVETAIDRSRLVVANNNLMDSYLIYSAGYRSIFFQIEYSKNGVAFPGKASHDISKYDLTDQYNVRYQFPSANDPIECAIEKFTINGVEGAETITTMEHTTSGTIYPISEYTQSLAGTTSIYLMNRADLLRPLRGTMKRFYIRSYVQIPDTLKMDGYEDPTGATDTTENTDEPATPVAASTTESLSTDDIDTVTSDATPAAADITYDDLPEIDAWVE